MTDQAAASGADDIVIGLDLGTTSTKAVAFTVAGEQLATASHGYPLEMPFPGHAVQNPDLILAAAYAAVAEVVAEVGAERVRGLSFSSAMHSLLGLDPLYRPMTEVITWGDTRAGLQAERLRAATGGLALHRRTGTPIHPMSPLPKLVWFREQEPKLHENVAFWVGIKDYVILHMCGALVVDHSLASASGLMNIHTLTWDDEALAIAGVSAEQLPELVRTRDVLPGITPDAARVMGLPETTPVVVGAGDGPLANLGVGAVRPGVAACSIGTSGALRVGVDKPAVDPMGGVFCYALTEDRWVIGGAINNGGATLDWVRSILADELGPGSEAELLELAARGAAGFGRPHHAAVPAERAGPALERAAQGCIYRTHSRAQARAPDPGRARGSLPAARARAAVDAVGRARSHADPSDRWGDEERPVARGSRVGARHDCRFR